MQDQGSPFYIVTRLVKGSFLLVFSLTLILSLFYVVGNYQGFTDATQLQLLIVMQAAGGVATVGSLIVVLLDVTLFILYRRVREIVQVILVVVGGVIALGITLGSSGLLVFLQPV